MTDPQAVEKLKEQVRAIANTAYVEESMATFNELLDSLSTVDPKLRLLWKQIYENAVIDRRNAYMLWTDLCLSTVGHGPEQHVIHGDHLSKYMERMEKSNIQLLKLAELVYKAKEKQEFEQLPMGDALYDMMKKNQPSPK